MLTRAQIAAGLRELGLAPGDVAHVHSSLSSFGQVDGGAEAVIGALLDCLTPTGTLLLPSYGDFDGGEYGKCLAVDPIFDVRSSPSRMGKITDVFWRMPGARRSLHPTHSTAAIGARQGEFLEGHDRCPVSCGFGTPLWKLIAARGKIVLLGVDHRVNTFIHTLEDTSAAPTTSRHQFRPQVIGYDGIAIQVPTYPHLPGLVRKFDRADELCRRHNLQREGKIGNATIRVIDAAGFARVAHAVLRENPTFFIDTGFYSARGPRPDLGARE